MLHGMRNVTPAIVEEMEKSEFDFYLTGARFFGSATEESNWEFFAQNSTEITEWLEKHSIVKEDTVCILTNDVLEVKHMVGVVEVHNKITRVFIHLVDNLKKKILVQNRLFNVYGKLMPTDPDILQMVWKTAYGFYNDDGYMED